MFTKFGTMQNPTKQVAVVVVVWGGRLAVN